MVQPHVLPGHLCPEHAAWRGYGDAPSRKLCSALYLHENELSFRNEGYCLLLPYYLKKSLKQEDRSIQSAWAELRVAGAAVISWVSSPVNTLKYANMPCQGWSDARPSQHKIAVGKHLIW